MGILSEIFAELADAMSGQSLSSKSSGGTSPYGMADPFASTQKKQTVKSKTAPKNVPISQQKTELEMHAHKHPAKNANSRTEKRPAYAGSLGNLSDEGCAEHGDERYISTSKPMVSVSKISVSDMRKAVVMSEILGKPKAKR